MLSKRGGFGARKSGNFTDKKMGGVGGRVNAWFNRLIPGSGEKVSGMGRDAVGRMIDVSLNKKFDGRSSYASHGAMKSKIPILASSRGGVGEIYKSRLS
jgi:hypothetical protein